MSGSRPGLPAKHWSTPMCRWWWSACLGGARPPSTRLRPTSRRRARSVASATPAFGLALMTHRDDRRRSSRAGRCRSRRLPVLSSPIADSTGLTLNPIRWSRHVDEAFDIHTRLTVALPGCATCGRGGTDEEYAIRCWMRPAKMVSMSWSVPAFKTWNCSPSERADLRASLATDSAFGLFARIRSASPQSPSVTPESCVGPGERKKDFSRRARNTSGRSRQRLEARLGSISAPHWAQMPYVPSEIRLSASLI
jgi:hypothetical protein